MAKLCECGCGQEITRRDRPCRPNRFLFGHQGKGKPSKHRTVVSEVVDRLVVCEPDTLETGCWEWRGRKKSDKVPYGCVSFEGKEKLVHCLVYEHFVGPIPDGYELHHRCENPPCANPDHLEALTRKQHLGGRHLKTHCKNGYEFTLENTKHTGKQRVCRQCIRDWALANYYANKEKFADRQRRYRAKKKALKDG